MCLGILSPNSFTMHQRLPSAHCVPDAHKLEPCLHGFLIFSGGLLSVGLACKSWSTQEQQNYQAGSESESYWSGALTFGIPFSQSKHRLAFLQCLAFPHSQQHKHSQVPLQRNEWCERANGDRGKGCSICSLQAKGFLSVKEREAISL